MIQIHKFGEVTIFHCKSEEDFNGMTATLHRIKPEIDDNGHAYVAIVPKDFMEDPEADQMIRNCLDKAMAGFRGWWDLGGGDIHLRRYECYHCDATSIEEDGDWVIYECGAICRFPNTESDAFRGDRARVMSACPVGLSQYLAEIISTERYRTVAENLLPVPGAPKDTRPTG